jgi:signal transduction histidine kinase/CheY-like chemotaxis protein
LRAETGNRAFSENHSEGKLKPEGAANGGPDDQAGTTLTSAIDADNASIAARAFRIIGAIVFIFQFLYLAADAHYLPSFLPYYTVNALDAVLAILITRSRWFVPYWRPLALFQVGLLDVTGAIMNILAGTVTPHFYTIITFSFGCATFLPWGVLWQSGLNLLCLFTYIVVNLTVIPAEPLARYQWIALIAVLILSEFPAAFIDRYRLSVFHQLEELTQALRASRDKSEFLASMSHEMRTLLGTIVGMTELLEGTTLTPEQSQYLSICHASGDILIALINDIVDISRIEARELQLHHLTFDLEELLSRVAEAVALRAHRKDLELITEITQDTPVKLIGDPMRLQQVCLNLLVNAIKFTEQGQIVIRIERDSESSEPGALLFCVADTGIGISSEEKRRIFSRFARGESGLSNAHEGSGLGLEISRRLVESMGGKIWVESVPGMGSTFYFTCRMEIQPAALADDTSDRVRLSGMRVLVIDDNAASRMAIARTLENAGASVALCGRAMQARQQLANACREDSEYQVILLDAEIPPDDSIELAQEFDGSNRERTIIMLARDDLRGPRFAREAGISRYLLKPPKRAELLDAVASVAGRRAGLPQLAVHSAAEPSHVARPLRTLLAEDSEDNRLAIAAFLRTTPYQLDCAENGRVAAEMFRNRRYDLVLLDINMPVLNGYGAIAAMREWEREQNIGPTPIVALTGRAMVEDRTRSLEAGFVGHLTKPLRGEILLEAISRFTNEARSLTQH